MNKKKYFKVFMPQNDIFNYLKHPKGIPFDFIKQNKPIAYWPEIQLKLQDEHIPDYTFTYFANRICSKKLKEIIESFDPEKKIQWLPFDVLEINGNVKKYFELHIPEAYDVLDASKTTYDKTGGVIAPRFSYSKIKDKDVFSYSNSSRALVVSETLKKAIQKAGCKNIIFSKAPVFYDDELANHE